MNIDAPTFTSAWVSEKQLAAHLGVSVRHLHNLRLAGLPHIRLGGSVKYDLAEVETFIRAHRRLSSHVERQKRRTPPQV
jgi:hypothetical protein